MSKFKLNLKTITNELEARNYNGMEALEIPENGIVLVLPDSFGNAGDILIRLDNDTHPFKTLNPVSGKFSNLNGPDIWGNHLEGYSFRYYPELNEKSAYFIKLINQNLYIS